MKKNDAITIFLCGLFGVVIYAFIAFLPKPKPVDRVQTIIAVPIARQIEEKERKIELSKLQIEKNLAEASTNE